MTSQRAMMPASAVPAFMAMLHAQQALPAPTPCEADPAAFYARAAAARAAAAELCHRCPLRQPCGDYATAARERWGVWGGRDRTPVIGRPAGRRATTEEKP